MKSDEVSFDAAVKELVNASGQTEYEVRKAISTRVIRLHVTRGFDGEAWVQRSELDYAIRRLKGPQ